ncbi:DUF4870 domain-containing protein [Chloroflexota bacterium]
MSPEERRRIYEEEKAKIETNQKKDADANGSTTGLEPNVAGLLCYLGAWITGIIFFIIEQKSKFVRFHALQSIVTFGGLAVVGAILGWIPLVGSFFGAAVGILAFILWILLMVKAYHGEWYKVPLAGRVAEGIIPATWRDEKPYTGGEQSTASYSTSNEAQKPPEDSGALSPTTSEKVENIGKRVDDYLTRTRAGRIAGYSVAIFWSIALLIFFSFFNQYIAWYHVGLNGSVTRLPMLTGDYFIWLPILISALVISIAANIFLIIYDKFWLREIIQIILSVIGVVVVANLVSIFPFDFGVISNTTAVDVVPIVVTIFLVVMAVGFAVGALVRFIKLIYSIAKRVPS